MPSKKDATDPSITPSGVSPRQDYFDLEKKGRTIDSDRLSFKVGLQTAIDFQRRSIDSSLDELASNDPVRMFLVSS
jgi:hypothetical protein